MQDRDGIDLLALAEALEHEFSVALPRDEVARLGTYGDLFDLLRRTLADTAAEGLEDDRAAGFVRARIVAGGSDGRVALVRVGWLTPDLVSAIADDLQHAPVGTWLQVLVPDDLADGEMATVQEWMRSLISPTVRIDVARQRERIGLRPSATPPCDQLPQSADGRSTGAPDPRSADGGTPIALSDLQLAESQLHNRHRRRSES
jgi:hypothetical protein